MNFIDTMLWVLILSLIYSPFYMVENIIKHTNANKNTSKKQKDNIYSTILKNKDIWLDYPLILVHRIV